MNICFSGATGMLRQGSLRKWLHDVTVTSRPFGRAIVAVAKRRHERPVLGARDIILAGA